jgi:predicted nucleic acid-binding Zn ribbon protein
MTFPAKMERASQLIRGLKLPSGMMTAEELACSAWSEAVGKKIAAHTRAARLVRTRLVVEVEDKTWRQQLFSLTPFILFNLQKHLGAGVVEELELRIIPRRRDPQRAVQASREPLQSDEADAITDPVLRGLYKASRKKALA